MEVLETRRQQTGRLFFLHFCWHDELTNLQAPFPVGGREFVPGTPSLCRCGVLRVKGHSKCVPLTPPLFLTFPVPGGQRSSQTVPVYLPYTWHRWGHFKYSMIVQYTSRGHGGPLCPQVIVSDWGWLFMWPFPVSHTQPGGHCFSYNAPCLNFPVTLEWPLTGRWNRKWVRKLVDHW